MPRSNSRAGLRVTSPREPNAAAFDAAKARLGAVRGEGAANSPAAFPTDSSSLPATEQIVTSFAGVSYEQENQLLGQDQLGLWPPDPSIAVGPDSIVEVANSSLSIWSKNGTLLTPKLSDLNSFWIAKSDANTFAASAPTVLYDPSSGSWFASSMANDASNDSRTYVGVSLTSDPSGLWNIYTIGSNDVGTLYDLPKLAVTSDKVVMTWDDFSQGGSTFTGAETWVFDKSLMLAGQATPWWNTGPDPSRFAMAPAASSSLSLAYLVYNNSRPLPGNPNQTPSLGIVELSGSPAGQSGVTWTEYFVTIPSTSIPPDALQPSPGPSIATGDDRVQSAAWWNNQLWTTGNDLCYPDGSDGIPSSCLRVIEVNTSSTPALTQSFDARVPGSYLFDPAIALDSGGNTYVAFSQSSMTQFPSAATLALPAGGSYDSLGAPVTTQSGLGVSDVCGTSCTGSPNNNNAWGDYAAAAVDPIAGTVWVAAEFTGSASDMYDWGTEISQVALAPSTPTPSATTTPTATVTATNTPTTSSTSTSTTTPTTTDTPEQSATPTDTAAVTSSPTVTPTLTSTLTASSTVTATTSPTASLTRTATASATESSTTTPTPTASSTATPVVFALTPGVSNSISTRVNASLVTLDLPAESNVASIEFEPPTTPIPLTPSDPTYHQILGASVLVVARDVNGDVVTDLDSPATVSITFRPLGTNPNLARIYTLNDGAAQALLTSVQSIGWGQYEASATTYHFSPFTLLAPDPGTQVAQAYFPLLVDQTMPAGW